MNLLRCRGTIGRAGYFLIGTTLLIVKFAIDWTVARAIFERPWSPVEYLSPGFSLALLFSEPEQRRFYLTMLLIALPFIFAGISLTAMRLRSIGLSAGWTILFFVPGINFALFVLLLGLPQTRDLPLAASATAYPIRARIIGRDAGAMRYCVFSTGRFVEPIRVWDEPRLLKFVVTSNPPPMKEWSPWSDIHPPHLDNFLVSEGGEFRLIELPNNRTRLEGTTWYRHHMWPATYWRLWSDFIIHRIHLRVLHHVKRLSEGPV